MSSISFKVIGDIVGKERPRFNRYTGSTYTPSKTHKYEDRVKTAYICKYPSGVWVQNKEQPIGVSRMEFHFKMPASWSKKKKERFRLQWCMKKIDLDNCYKSVTDALVGTAYLDDSQICGIFGPVIKVWDNEEFVKVELTELEGEE